MFTALQDTAKATTSTDWLYLVTLELALFRPYFTLTDKSAKKYKELKYKADFDKEVFCVKQDIISVDVYKSIVKRYKKAISSLQNQMQKMAIGASATVAITIASGGLAWAFAPQIAVMLAGSSVAGLYGVALTEPCFDRRRISCGWRHGHCWWHGNHYWWWSFAGHNRVWSRNHIFGDTTVLKKLCA